MLRGARVTPVISPNSSNSISGSGRSKSIEPRRCALAVQDQRQLLHQLEARDQRRVALAQRRVAFQQQVDVGVGHALGAADHAARELLRHHVAVMIDLEQRGEHQAVLVRRSEQRSVESS